MIIINRRIIINCFFFSGTFGVQSVNITDSSNGRVCIECVFSLYSTDTGCTVELISSSIIQYTDTFTRPLSDNTATGCITNITTGLYTIRVYDQINTAAVEITGVNVAEPVVTKTMSSALVTSSIPTTEPTPITEQGSDGISLSGLYNDPIYDYYVKMQCIVNIILFKIIIIVCVGRLLCSVINFQ